MILAAQNFKWRETSKGEAAAAVMGKGGGERKRRKREWGDSAEENSSLWQIEGDLQKEKSEEEMEKSERETERERGISRLVVL